MPCACIFDARSVPCFRVEFRSVPVRSVPENRDGRNFQVGCPIPNTHAHNCLNFDPDYVPR